MLHACIFAATAASVFNIAYDRKIAGFADLLGMPESCLSTAMSNRAFWKKIFSFCNRFHLATGAVEQLRLSQAWFTERLAALAST